jgi:hypothetical protein
MPGGGFTSWLVECVDDFPRRGASEASRAVGLVVVHDVIGGVEKPGFTAAPSPL